MTTASLTRVVGFSAAHRYYRPDWTDEQNRAAFGSCTNEPGHGHNYRCAVTVCGSITNERSMVCDLTELDTLLHRHIVQPLDHQHINLVVPEFAYGATIPTAEALAAYLWKQLVPALPDGVRLERVNVEEDETLSAEYRGG